MASDLVPLGELGLRLTVQELALVAAQVCGMQGSTRAELWVRGKVPTGCGVAVVGTRAPTPEALAYTAELVGELAIHGIAIWSGGARGIDGAAHEAALKHGVPTVLVAPTGLDNPYPSEHAGLYETLAAGAGALVSLWPDDSHPMIPRFLQRNRLLVSLTAATIVVQAPLQSGARHAAGEARKLGRPLFVVPHCPWIPEGLGCVKELLAGAVPFWSAAQVLAAAGGPLLGPALMGRGRPKTRLATDEPRPKTAPKGSRPVPGVQSTEAATSRPHGRNRVAPELGELGDNEWKILNFISDAPLCLDDLCERSELPCAAVAQAVLTLTLRAFVVQEPAGHYRRTKLAPRP